MSSNNSLIAAIEDFCGDVFWDDGGIPNATVPNFSMCFQHTALVAIPSIFFWLLSPILCFQIYLEKSSPLQLSFQISAKLALSLFLSFDALFLFATAIYKHIRGDQLATVYYVYPIVLFVTMLGISLSIFFCYKYGKVTSGILFLTFLLYGICGIPEFYWWIQRGSNQMIVKTIDTPRYIAYLCWFPIIWIQLIFLCFADKRKTTNNRPMASPEMDSSFLNRQTLWWFNPIPAKGIKKPLVIDDLFELNDISQSRYLVPKWHQLWDKAMREYNNRKHELLNRVQQHSTKLQTNLIFDRTKKQSSYGSIESIASILPKNISKPLPPAPSIVYRLFLLFKYEFISATAVKIFSDVLQFANPLLLNALIDFTENKSAPLWNGIALAAAMFFASELRSFLVNNYFYLMFRAGTQIQTVLTAAVYQKTLRLSNSARRDKTVGEIVNLMAIDVDRFQMITSQIQQYWSSPFQITLALVFLWQTIGISALAGVAIMICFIPLNLFVSVIIKGWQVKQMRLKDERTKMVNEILNGVKVIKLYAWEQPMEDLVARIRDAELALIRKATFVRTIVDMFNTASPFLVALLSFTTFTLSDPSHLLTPQIAFVSLTLFNQLRVPMIMIAMLINQTVQAIVSNRRLKAYLVADELPTDTVDRRVSLQADVNDVIDARNATFSWDSASDISRNSLRDINFAVQKGQLIAVVGRVGVGKSSLLSAILGSFCSHIIIYTTVTGEMDKLKGYIRVRGKLAYVPQQSWIQNMTLRANVTFSKPYNDVFYNRVIDACALRPDLAMLPNGDSTEIGEKGINLSGGQKARVSLARAVYQNLDVYLLDDPLSAVDSHVGRHIFKNVIGPEGMLRNKSRILITHSLTYLKHADLIIVLDDGKISEIGSYADLINDDGAFSRLVEEFKETDDQLDDEEMEGEEEAIADEEEIMITPEDSKSSGSPQNSMQTEMTEIRDGESDLIDAIHQQTNEPKKLTEKSPLLPPAFHAQISTVSGIATASRPPMQSQVSAPATTRSRKKRRSTIEEVEKVKNIPANTKLIQVEQSETGRVWSKVFVVTVISVPESCVKTSVYMQYFKSMNYLFALGVLLGMSSNTAVSMYRSIWLTEWSDEQLKFSDSNGTIAPMPIAVRLGVYAALGFTEIILLFFGLVSLMYGGISASRNLHAPLLHNLLRSPMSFFDTTPLGRVLNRIGKDIDVIDMTLPMNFRLFLMCLLMILSTLIIIMISTPIFGVVIIPLALIYLFALRYYLATSRQLKRLESTTRSPIYSHFGETVQGAASIRAYGVVNEFCIMSEQQVDTHIRVKYLNLIANRWLAVRLEFVGNCIILFASLFAVLSKNWTATTAGAVGLSVSYALSMTEVLSFAVRMVSETETNIVSVERVKEYTETPTEADWHSIHGLRLPKNWPQHGHIRFDNYSTRYRPGLDLVVKKLNIDISSGQKIGIVGRTGAGKSSMALALFRLIEPVDGRIIIDDVDVSTIGLHELRQNLTIIPQDPVLFSGTLRFNIDPFNRHSDVDIWSALEHAHLKDFAMSNPQRLQHLITEGGDNISMGQRQLVCLARAVLRRSKVLVLDEATAAVDVTTDALIQNTIRTEFVNSTVLTVAHRLNTILDYDRILVLDHGEIAEFDTPQRLLANEKSLFYALVEDSKLEK